MNTYLRAVPQPGGMKRAVSSRCANQSTTSLSGRRELLAVEANEVSGGYSALDGFELGLAVGIIAGAVSMGTTIGATRDGIIDGAIGFSWGFGYGIGTAIYSSWNSRGLS